MAAMNAIDPFHHFLTSSLVFFQQLLNFFLYVFQPLEIVGRSGLVWIISRLQVVVVDQVDLDSLIGGYALNNATVDFDEDFGRFQSIITLLFHQACFQNLVSSHEYFLC